MSRRLPRWPATAALIGAAALAVPGLAALMAPRTAAPPQISLNVATPAFAVSGMVAGDSVTRCLRVRNEGEEAVGLYAAAAVTGALASFLRVAVENGTGLGDAGPSCAGFRPSGSYVLGTTAAGVAPGALQPAYLPSLAAHAERSLRVTVALPAGAPLEASAQSAEVRFLFSGVAIEQPAGEEPARTPDLPGGIAPGTTGGIDINGDFIPNAEVKRRLRVGKARLLKNGDVVVRMFLPAGGAIRAKVLLPNGRMYAHTLLPEEWGPNLKVVIEKRESSWRWLKAARRQGRRVVGRVTTRYRWAHGPDAFVQPEQKLVLAKKKRR